MSCSTLTRSRRPCFRAFPTHRSPSRRTAPVAAPRASHPANTRRAAGPSSAQHDVFRTVVDAPPITPRLTYASSCLLLGSCFADNIGAKLVASKFATCANPFGTIFNPVSIARLLHHAADPSFVYTPSCLASNGTTHFSYDHHSSLSSEDPNTCLAQLNAQLVIARSFLTPAAAANTPSPSPHTPPAPTRTTVTPPAPERTTPPAPSGLSHQFLLLTLGTSWVYRHQGTDAIVANCQKSPSRLFSKELLTPDAAVDALQSAVNACLEVNPTLQVILTVSPVRHWKDGPIQNQASKAVLVLAAHELCRRLPGTVQYFPAYEILLDDLRDYRFYQSDMLHPSDAAVDYIWGRLVGAWVEPGTMEAMARVEGVVAATRHRPLHRGSVAHRSFLEQTAAKLAQLMQELPHADFEPEWGRLESAGWQQGRSKAA